jgi:carboxypeptidase Q
MLRRKLLSAILIYTFLLSGATVFGQDSPKVYEAPRETIDKIRDEGLKNSQVMQTLSYLTDVIGGRLTGSPNMKRANEWTRDTMAKWGMQNAKLEAWGPFGRGWSLKGFTAQVISPELIPVTAYPKAWSPSTKGKITGEVVFFDAKTDADFEKYRGKLKKKIVLVSQARPLPPIDKPLVTRISDEDLLKLTNAPAPDPSKDPNGFTQEQINNFLKFFNFQARQMKFLLDEGAAVMIDNSGAGSGGTLFVQGAGLTIELSPNIKTIQDLLNDPGFQPQRKGAEANMVPQMTMASEDYNRIVRMIQFGARPAMTVQITAQSYEDMKTI